MQSQHYNYIPFVNLLKLGTLGPLFLIWEDNIKYESRYTHPDHFHQIFDVLRFTIVGMAALHIRPIRYLGCSENIESFLLPLFLYISAALRFLSDVELYLFAVGDRTPIQNSTKAKIIQSFPFDSFYFAAAILSGYSYFSYNDTDAEDSICKYDAEGKKYIPKESDASWSPHDLPLTLCCVSYWLRLIFQFAAIQYHRSCASNINFLERYIPYNIEYLIGRYNDWVILMIAEAVLALLLNDITEDQDYYYVITLGIFTITTIQILKYEGEPRKPSRHALFRSTTGGKLYSITIQTLSFALIAVSLFMFLFFIFVIGCSLISILDNLQFSTSLKLLVIVFEEKKNASSDEDTKDHIPAVLFSGSLSTVLTCLEIMHLSHDYRIFHVGDDDDRSIDSTMVVSEVIRVLLIIFVATLWRWQEDSLYLALLGFLAVMFFTFSRVVVRKLRERLESAKDISLKGSFQKLKLSRSTSNGSATAWPFSTRFGSASGSDDFRDPSLIRMPHDVESSSFSFLDEGVYTTSN